MPEKQKQANVIHGKPVYGVDVDDHTRCAHWHDENDIIAILFHCCERFYPCFDCHLERADHPPTVWPPAEWNRRAILCGACGQKLTITEYMKSASRCPTCDAAFNPNCADHYHLYFSTPA
ncbi:MAG: CHY zinc finger protein [Gammaproteobacteria bacterium]|nr:CHY zinc finger protein [Gammaproteobacteria bacterium]